MMRLRITKAILLKQIKDTIKNKVILIQFIMFPLLTVALVNSVDIVNMPENFFINLFTTMFIGMAPMVSLSSIIAEEKEGKTLRVLFMSGVRASEYLIGVSIYVIVLCMCGGAVMGLQANYTKEEFLAYLIIILTGIIVSAILGSIIGIYSKNQMQATSITVPLMMVFSMFPMISYFNNKFRMVSRFFYSQQISNLLESISNIRLTLETVLVIVANLFLFLFIFIIIFWKKGIE